MAFREILLAGVAGLGIAAMVAPADGAVSVLGNGLSQSCFQSAEYGGDPKEGVETCTVALEQTPLSSRDKAATLINRGILRGRMNDAEHAIEDYNHGLSLDGTLGEGYVDRGAAEIVLRQYDAALADIDKGLGLHANKPEIAYYDRGIVDEALGNIKDAYADYKKAVELQPNFDLANQQLMRFKVVRKHTDGA